MIRKIIHKLKKYDRQLNYLERSQEKTLNSNEIILLNQQIQFDYYQITQLFTKNEIIPFTSWSISPSTILHILNEILLNEKKCIIEFGSGSSTFFIAKFLKVNQLSDVRFISVDSDKNWITKMKKMGTTYNVEDWMNLVHSPISEIEMSLRWKEQIKWYSSEMIKPYISKGELFDMIIVDGPWGGFSPYSRYSAIPFLKENIADNYTIFLDDTFREEELNIAKEWAQDLKCTLKHFNKYSVLTNIDSYNVEPFRLTKWKSQ